MSRLHLRLFIPTALILIACISAVGIYTHWRTQQAFQSYVTVQKARHYLEQARVLASASALLYRTTGSWGAPQAIMLDRVKGAKVVIVDPSRQIVAGSIGERVGTAFTASPGDISVRIPPALTLGAPVTLYLIPPLAEDLAKRAFLQNLSSVTILAGVAGVTAALILTFILVRTLTRPITAMTRAAARLQQGDLSQRVVVPPGDDEVADLAHAFNAMAESLHQAAQQRQTLTADIAHELRTPLTSVRGYLEALQDGAIAPTPRVIDALHEEIITLSLLVNDLQDLALADAGALSLHPQRQMLAPILEQAVAMQQAAAAARTIRLTLEPSPGLEAAVDALRLGQVLRNLIANALLHTPAGGTVTLTAQQGAGGVAILVRDSGRGIPPEHLPHIFDRFYRADPSRDRATGGAGIGLSVARSIVEAHGGTITVESVLGTGTTFRILLPARRHGADSAGVAGPARADEPPVPSDRAAPPDSPLRRH